MKDIVLKYDIESEHWIAFFIDEPHKRATGRHQQEAVGNLIFKFAKNLGIKILYQQG